MAKAERDGYTIMYDATAHSVNPSLYANPPYDTVNDFQPVFLGALVTNLLVVNKSVEVKTVADVIALAKATPGGLEWASSGNGTVQHLALEMLKWQAGIQLNHVPYRGGGLVLNDLIGGQIKFYFSNAAASIGHVQSGTLKCIAHTGKGRLATLPDVPAVAETLPGFEAYEWQGVFVRIRDSAGDRREAQCRLERGGEAARRRRAPREAQRRDPRQHARGIPRLRRVRDGEVGQGGARREYQVGMSVTSLLRHPEVRARQKRVHARLDALWGEPRRATARLLQRRGPFILRGPRKSAGTSG